MTEQQADRIILLLRILTVQLSFIVGTLFGTGLGLIIWTVFW